MSQQPTRDEFWRPARRHSLIHRLLPAYRRTVGRVVYPLFHLDLIQRTRNFNDVTWLGHPVWQNVLDLWTIQETISEVRPALIVETGTNRGGSALFFAHLCDLMGDGRVVSVDVSRMHDLEHPRITFLVGSSTDPGVFAEIEEAARSVTGPVMVILDSDHSAAHVRAELDLYANLVTPGSYILVQDGHIDTLPTARSERPGPLAALRDWLPSHPEFEVDAERNSRFLITHHPLGWLRRRR